MTTPTIPQAQKRFRTLSPLLQDTIFSVHTAEIVKRVCEENHLAEDKSPNVAEAAGLVLLGYLHPEEVAREITERAGIPAQTASAIAQALSGRLFNPIRTELDRAYAPSAHGEEISPPAAAEPPKPRTETFVDLATRTLRKPEGMRGTQEAGRIPPAPPSPPPPAPAIPPTLPAGGVPAIPPPLLLHEESRPEPIGVSPLDTLQANQRIGEVTLREPEPPKPAKIEFGPPKSPVPPHAAGETAPQARGPAKSFDAWGGLRPPTPEPRIGSASPAARPEPPFQSAPQPGTSSVPLKTDTPSPPRVVHYSELKTPLTPSPEPASAAKGPGAPPASFSPKEPLPQTSAPQVAPQSEARKIPPPPPPPSAPRDVRPQGERMIDLSSFGRVNDREEKGPDANP